MIRTLVAYVALARLYWPVSAILATWATLIGGLGFALGRCTA